MSDMSVFEDFKRQSKEIQADEISVDERIYDKVILICVRNKKTKDERKIKVNMDLFYSYVYDSKYWITCLQKDGMVKVCAEIFIDQPK